MVIEHSFSRLAEISANLERTYVNTGEDLWHGSPFAWIRTRPSRQVGAIGEALVSEWAKAEGFKVQRSPNSDADRVVNGWRIEIKMSTLWTDTRIYKFQQIRDQDYDFCFCFGLSPQSAHSWLIPKEALLENRPGLVHQHGGARGSDTRWLSFTPESPLPWLAPYGGSMDKTSRLLKNLGIGPHRGR